MGSIEKEEKLEDVMAYYKNVREALAGLTDILSISFNENDFYHQAAMDNLKALHVNVLKMLKASFTPREIRMQLRELEFDEKEAEKVFPL